MHTPNPSSPYRVKFNFRAGFTNGGHVHGEHFLLDLEGSEVDDETPK